jgi:SAM-dependent methyltransferase
MKDFYLSRTAFVIDALQDPKRDGGRQILDVGFLGEYGEPGVHQQVLDALPSRDRMVAVDTNREGLRDYLQRDETRRRMARGNVEYRAESLFDTGGANAFDAVLLLEVIEHLALPYHALHRAHALLKPEGCLIMTYPNPLGLKRTMRYIAEPNPADPRFLHAFRGDRDHKIFPHPACIAVYLNELGFTGLHIVYIKHEFRRTLVNRGMLKWSWTRKFATYVGVVAMKRR